jgi:hypothetical protein
MPLLGLPDSRAGVNAARLEVALGAGVVKPRPSVSALRAASLEFPRSPIPDVGMHRSASLSTTATSRPRCPGSGRPLSGYTSGIP